MNKEQISGGYVDPIKWRKIALKYLQGSDKIKDYYNLYSLGTFEGMGMPANPSQFYHKSWNELIGKGVPISDPLEWRKIALKYLSDPPTRGEYSKLYKKGTFHGLGMPQNPLSKYKMTWNELVGKEVFLENYLDWRAVALKFLNGNLTSTEYYRLHKLGVFKGMGMTSSPISFYRKNWVELIGKEPTLIEDPLEWRKIALSFLKDNTTWAEYDRLYKSGAFSCSGLKMPSNPMEKYGKKWNELIGKEK